MRLAVASLLVLLVASPALAEGPETGPVMTPEGQPVQQQPQPQPVQQQPTAAEGRGIEYGAHIFVPIFVTETDLPDLTPGIGIAGRIGWEFGSGFSAELNLGIQANFFGETTDGTGAVIIDSGSLTSFYVGGGIRYAILTALRIVPFFGLGVAAHFFDGCAEATTGASVCTDTRDVSVAANGVVGLAYEITAAAALEAGAQVNVLFPNGDNTFPRDTQVFVSPFIGGTLYY
ncbi:MAG: hypothetical protein AAGF12_27300 [Myxococcota bacterium]